MTKQLLYIPEGKYITFCRMEEHNKHKHISLEDACKRYDLSEQALLDKLIKHPASSILFIANRLPFINCGEFTKEMFEIVDDGR